MKKTMFYAALVAIATGSIFTSCDSKAEKVEEAKEDVRDANAGVRDAKADLREAEHNAKEAQHDANDAQHAVNEGQRELNAEYPQFRTEAEARIAESERRIALLHAELNRPGQGPLDGLREKKIIDLERRNAQLKSRLYSYENERTDWATFKREFQRDMDGIAKSCRDLAENKTR
jgi:hypothetical protein